MYDTVGSDWQALGGVQYRRLDIYPQLDWGGSSEDCRLDQHVIAAAHFGGPIAMVRDDAALSKLIGSTHGPPLRMFTSAGRLLAEVPWEGPSAGGRLIAMGWTSSEMLVTVREQGLLQLRDLRGTLLQSLQLLDSPPTIATDGTVVLITHAVVWGDAVAAATSDLQLLGIENLQQYAARAAPTTPRSRAFILGRGALQRLRPRPKITAVTASSGSSSGSSSGTALELIVAAAGGDTWLVNEESAVRAALPEELLLTSSSAGSSDTANSSSSSNSSIVRLAVSPGGLFVACFTSAGVLAVLKDGLTAQVMAFDTSTREPPQQMVWCGEDCVVLHWPGLGVLMVGPGGDWTKFPYPRSNPLVLVHEIDCCRIISQQRMELLQRVPATTEAINRIGSTDPAAMLFDATEAFEDGDAKADENIRSMARADDSRSSAAAATSTVTSTAASTQHNGANDETADGSSSSSSSGEGVLQEAVRSCTLAAAAEFDTARQKALLRAAAYGKGFLPDYDSDDFVACCRKLRVLNSIRAADVGIPLTSQQYDAVTAEAVIDMLIRRRLHHLALKACEHLRIPAKGVAISWACERLTCSDVSTTSDEALCDVIRARLAPHGRVSFADVARTALAVGRRPLATMLLDLEPITSDQVPLLLSMSEEERALKKAISSGDGDLVTLALLHIEKAGHTSTSTTSSSTSPLPANTQVDQETVYKLIHAHPEALSLLKAYYKSRSGYAERQQLHQLLMYKGHCLEAGTIAIQAAYQQERLEDRITGLKEADQIFSHNRDLAFQQSCTRDEIELLELQKELERKTNGACACIDSSLYDTIYQLICLSSGSVPGSSPAHGSTVAASVTGLPAGVTPAALGAEALRLAKRFKMPDKRLWHLRVRALAESDQWSALKALANERKSPIGYRPFATIALQHGQSIAEIEGYADRIVPSDDRYEFYMEAGMYSKAAETARLMKDQRRLFEAQQAAES